MSNQQPDQAELEAFMVKFEHELSLHVAGLDSEFDGRLGDRKAGLKRNMVRFTRYYVNQLIATERTKAEQAGYERGKREVHQSWSIVFGIGYDPDNIDLPKNIQTLRSKWSTDNAALQPPQSGEKL